MGEQTVHGPGSLAELGEIVAWAVGSETALEVVGRGTKRGLGRPVEARHTLALDRLSGVAMYEPNELVLSAGAGTPVAEIEATLAETGQMLAFEPPDTGALLGGERGRGTIGGVFGCNLAGPRRLRAGAARDHLLGAQCVTGHGQVVKTGGRVVKNVTGYDLCKLLTGSFGTLAAMSQLTFKVLPAPPASATVLLAGPEERLLPLLRRAVATPHDVSGAAMMPTLAAGRSRVPEVRAASRPVAALRVEGTEPSIAYRSTELVAALAGAGVEAAVLDADATRRLWREIADVELLPRARPLWRLTLAPTAAGALLDRLREAASERLFDWAGGLVWLAPPLVAPDAGASIRDAVAGAGGAATLVRAGAELRRRVGPMQPLDPALAALTRRVKTSFDPKRVLNPGRMYADL